MIKPEGRKFLIEIFALHFAAFQIEIHQNFVKTNHFHFQHSKLLHFGFSDKSKNRVKSQANIGERIGKFPFLQITIAFYHLRL